MFQITAAEGVTVRYEDQLRSLGAYMDEGNWRTLRLFEMSDRILLQGRSTSDGGTVERWLAAEDVAALFSQLARRRARGHGWRESGHVPGSVGGTPPVTMLGRLRRQHAPLPHRLGTTYEDMLRALGHLADQAHWYDLRLFELEEGILFQGRPARVPDALTLTSQALSEAEVRELLRASYARRRRPGTAHRQPAAPPDHPAPPIAASRQPMATTRPPLLAPRLVPRPA